MSQTVCLVELDIQASAFTQISSRFRARRPPGGAARHHETLGRVEEHYWLEGFSGGVCVCVCS